MAGDTGLRRRLTDQRAKVVEFGGLNMLAEPIEREKDRAEARVAEVSELIQYPRRSRWRRLIRWWRRWGWLKASHLPAIWRRL
jgi:hypothetical protein